MIYQGIEALLKVPEAVWLFTVALVGLAGVWDWRSRRIPNWLTVPGLFSGIIVNVVMTGWHGLTASLEGAGLALTLLLPLVLMRALGAGDWKLMGAVGAFLGPWPFLVILLVSTAISALMGMVKVVQAKRVKATLFNLIVLFQGFLAFGFRAHPEISLDNPGLIKLPFGVAVAAATIFCFVLTRLGL